VLVTLLPLGMRASGFVPLLALPGGPGLCIESPAPAPLLVHARAPARPLAGANPGAAQACLAPLSLTRRSSRQKLELARVLAPRLSRRRPVTVVNQQTPECIFCQIISGTRRAEVVFESESTIAFLDRFPAARGHTLVVPKRHAPTLPALEEGAAGALFGAVLEVMDLLSATLKPVGFNVGWNHGSAAGQHVFHLHVHVLPRFRGGGSGVQALGEGVQESDLAGVASLMRSGPPGLTWASPRLAEGPPHHHRVGDVDVLDEVGCAAHGLDPASSPRR